MLEKLLKFRLPLSAGVALAAFLGFVSIVMPPHALNYFEHGEIIRGYPAPLFPLVRSAWENLEFFPTIFFLFIVGGGVGVFAGKNWWICSFFMIIIFPIITFLEIVVDSTSHNLWPFEIIFQLLLAIPGLIGALVARQSALWVSNRLSTKSH